MSAKYKPRLHVIATQHLDVAWLWTRAPYGEELMRQCFERAVEIIEADPDGAFIFSRSTVWSFEVVERLYPDLFEKIKKYVAEGRIELCGGEWIEPDHLMPSGESLIRQSAYGQWYYLEKFGKKADVCWDPDIFGHPHTMPQIIKKCGMDGFYSHRCRPRDTNNNPLYQFIWEGPDGSKIYYLAGTWTPDVSERSFNVTLENQKHQGLPSVHAVTGQTSDRRITMKKEWLTEITETAEKLEFDECRWSAASDVLEDMKTYADRLPVVTGELGFQFSGTYTSDQYNKRMNRSIEQLLGEAECAAAWAASKGFRYPKQQLTRAWKDHCVNQFHDIICGCSLSDAHTEDRELWADVSRRGTFARDEALAYLCDRIYAGLDDKPGDKELYACFNLLGWERNVHPEIPLKNGEGVKASINGETLPVQIIEKNGERKALIKAGTIAGSGYALVSVIRNDGNDQKQESDAEPVLENEFLRAEIDPASGELVSLLDKKTGSEYLGDKRRGNRLEFLGDAKKRMPAWSIEYTGEEFGPAEITECTRTENGPVRQCVRVKRKIQLSKNMPETIIIQDIILYADSPVLYFRTHGQWYAEQVFLKTAFDLPFEVTGTAAEAPYGVIERDADGTGRKRELDADTQGEDGGASGKETEEPDLYMQKWVDASDGKTGALFLNDSLHGYDVADNTLRLSLLRSPMEPFDHVGLDSGVINGLGPFELSYGIVLHTGDWREADAARTGYEFRSRGVCRPVRDGFEPDGFWRDWWDTKDNAPAGVPESFVQIKEQGSTLLTAVKQAEDGNGIILRFVEYQGKEDTAEIQTALPIISAEETDMLELPVSSEESREITVSDTTAVIAMKPWEIKTVRLILT